MPLIIKAAGERIYIRNGADEAYTGLYGLQKWQHIKDRSDIANVFKFDLPLPCLADGSLYIPGNRDEVFIYKSEADYLSDTRWFGGLITEVNDGIVLKGNDDYVVTYTITAQAFDIVLDKELRQPLISNQTWASLLETLLSRHFSTQLSADFSFISNPNPAPPVKLVNGSLRNLLKAMRALTSYDFYVDAYKRLHVFHVDDQPAGFTLNDNPSIPGLLTFSTRPQATYDSRSLFNIVRQPFQQLVGLTEWEGESFTAKGDPKGQGGQFPLLRTPTSIEETVQLQEKFDGNTISATTWIETDTTTTEHVDYPSQGFMFTANGQLQVVGGTGTLGGVALVSQDFYSYTENNYLIQEFQLTNTSGDGYICLFTDGLGLATGNFRAGLRVNGNNLYALDGTLLVTGLGTTTNYLLWVTQTATGWQYDIQGGVYATKQRIRTETGVTHLASYKLAPIINKSLHCSINSVRYKTNDLQFVLEIDGVKKTVGIESSDTDLPDIDAFLNIDETPALIKFKAASALAVIASVADATHFTVATGQGTNFQPGHRLLVGDNILEAFNGREAFVSSVAGDTITLVSPGLTSPLATASQQVLINTTVPAKNARLLMKYAFVKIDEAVAADQESIDQFGPFPTTLDEKDHIKAFNDAQLEAENYLNRFKDGILKLSFGSNSKLLSTEPNSQTALPVNLSRRPDPIVRTITIQRVIITPVGRDQYRYDIEAESADATKPLEDIVIGKALVIGQDGTLRFTVNPTVIEASDTELTIHQVSSLYITLGNPEHRRLGEFRLKP